MCNGGDFRIDSPLRDHWIHDYEVKVIVRQPSDVFGFYIFTNSEKHRPE
jgi:hypothetical protein